MIRPCDTCSLPTTGTLFSAWQAITHALHPVHTFKSILIPHCCGAFSGGCVEIPGGGRRKPSCPWNCLGNSLFGRYPYKAALRTRARLSRSSFACVIRNG